MLANNLREIFKYFVVTSPLVTKEELDQCFVERPNGPLKHMEQYLCTVPQPAKILFTGHRGSGKSTELNKLVMNLHDQFFIVKISIRKSLDLYDLNYVDVLYTCALKLLQQAYESKIKINKGLLKHIFEGLHYDEITEEKVITISKEGDISGNLNLLAVKMEGKLNKEEVTRKIMRREITPRLSELIENINLIIDEIKGKTEKDVLIIIEDTDKTTIDIAQKLFFQYGESLLSINSKIIYTYPIALRYSNDFSQIAKTFKVFFLPNLTIFDKYGKKDDIGYEKLKEVVSRRINPSLIKEDALDEIIKLSGGLMIELISIIQGAALDSLANEKNVIDSDAVRNAVNDIRNDYSGMLTKEQYQKLKEINEDKEKKIVNDPTICQLLHNLTLLEYRNGEVWADVHPIVKPLL